MLFEGEEVKPVTDCPGYFISNFGRVLCNLGKGNRRKNIDINDTSELYELNYRLTQKGYARVYMRVESTGKRKDFYVHRLVAIYFIDNPDGKRVVNHIDCDRTNNNVENLEWCTTKENITHAMTYGSLDRDKNNGQFVKKR